ncbi:MAG: gliding motility-associated ABC transporter permease subunit GldF [Verrucomicrobia bacterium]|nr:gliding motility-associated ABC transporter permease subunit GldF [Cytophagales bacterium]
MFSIFKKEINSFFSSLIAYIIIGIFLIGTGLFVWIFPDYNVLDYGYADLFVLFDYTPLVFLFLIPAITMRSFAEEKRLGTLELLFTRPLTDWQIVGGKFFACWLLAVVALLPTLLYYYAIYQLGEPVGNIDTAGVTGSYLGLILLAGAFTAIGIFASSLTDNQLVAFVIAVALCFMLYQGFGFLAGAEAWGNFAYTLQQLGMLFHYQALSRGLVDSRNVLYFVSLMFIMHLLTKLRLESRKW